MSRVLSRVRTTLSAAVLLILVMHTAEAKLHTGIALIEPGPAWDFSDSVAVTPPNGDLHWLVVALNSGARSQGAFPYFFLTDAPAAAALAPTDSTFEELSSAPTDSVLYQEGAELFTFRVYVVRTQEQHYAKVKIALIGAGGITIQYVYQDDGSRILAEPVAIEPVTWGRIKALYR